MNIPFGVNYKPTSRTWEDIRKGPSLDAVREHLDRVTNFGRYSMMGRSGKGTR